MATVQQILGKIGDQEVRLQRAYDRFTAEKAKLFRVDGSPFYSQQEHADRIQALLEPLRDAGEEVEKVITEARQEGAKLASLKDADLFGAVDTEVLQRATVLRSFVRDEVVSLAGGERLGDRLRAVRYHGDQAAKLAYLHEVAALRSADPLVTGPLGELRAELAGDATNKAKQATEESQKVRNAASGLDGLRYQLLGDADGSSEARQANRRQQYAGF